MKILIVEDQVKTGDYLNKGLTEAGFVVDVVRDGMEGLHRATTEDYDLAILDVMLPGLDGWRVLEGLRGAGREMPVLFLTARDQVDDRVKGLELGADDYLVKPFAFAELLARIRTLLRRGKSRQPETLTIVELEAAYKPRPRANYEAAIARAQAAYGIAKEECDDKKGEARKGCVRDARATQERAKAAAMAAMKASSSEQAAAAKPVGAPR